MSQERYRASRDRRLLTNIRDINVATKDATPATMTVTWARLDPVPPEEPETFVIVGVIECIFHGCDVVWPIVALRSFRGLNHAP